MTIKLVIQLSVGPLSIAIYDDGLEHVNVNS